MSLSTTDLVVDHIYAGSRNGNSSDDPLPALLGVDNGAGFRHLGKRPGIDTLKLLVLKSNFNNPDWPDNLDHESGLLTYYGDNKKPGDLHKTPRQGNLILRNLFEGAHTPTLKDHFPAIFVFGGMGKGTYRDVRFIGLAVPGAHTLGPDDDLVALWRSSGPENKRFQNYKAKFTILDVPVVSRAWINDIKAGNAVQSLHAPKAWLNWLNYRRYTPLYAPHSLETRNKSQQTPTTVHDRQIIELVYSTYQKNPYGFEKCAMEIARLMMPDIHTWELTRPWRDGGRDATGTYKMGNGPSSIDVEFALEAKCYQPSSGVGVKELSRLISRLRHRQFGILITTSYLGDSAYKELKEDGHPVVIISASDIVALLKTRIGNIDQVRSWLTGVNS